ncbi:MAG: cobyrinate a,c-diamide synthase [Nitrospirota bacterium]|jgi:cobyrinic acid a,c-diamide synthase
MALLIAGTHSGCGKSTVTLGVMAALRAGGLTVQGFKAGPDFIDPGLHTLVTGRPSRNLDLWMCGEKYVRRTLGRHAAGADAVVVEGVMGLYDGEERSTAALARAIGTEVVLVVDAYGMAESAGALVRGFHGHGLPLRGVIFNRVGSPRHEERLRSSVKEVEVLGSLPREARFAIPERHLGLVVAEERPLDEAALSSLAGAVSDNIDMARLGELARPAPLDYPTNDSRGPSVRLAVARDRAFCFYYEDNLDLLREAGAEVVFFSPLRDAELPPSADALYLGGGYPEVHAGELSANEPMRRAIRRWVEAGNPLYAECGGLLYLGEGVETAEGFHPLAGALPLRFAMKERRAALGYRELRAEEDCILCRRSERLRGHEFHYSEVFRIGRKPGVRYNVFGERGDAVESVLYKGTLAHYTHVHLGSNAGAARHFISFLKGAAWKA